MSGTDPPISEEDLVRYTAHYARKREREEVVATTDEDGNPYPRLDVDAPPSTTDDPLFWVGYALLAELPEEWESAMLMVAAGLAPRTLNEAPARAAQDQ